MTTDCTLQGCPLSPRLFIMSMESLIQANTLALQSSWQKDLACDEQPWKHIFTNLKLLNSWWGTQDIKNMPLKNWKNWTLTKVINYYLLITIVCIIFIYLFCYSFILFVSVCLSYSLFDAIVVLLDRYRVGWGAGDSKSCYICLT